MQKIYQGLISTSTKKRQRMEQKLLIGHRRMPSVCLLYYLMEIRRHEDMKEQPRDPTMFLALILLSRYLAGICPMWIAEKQEGRNEEVEEQVQAKAEPIQEFWNHRLWPVAKEEFKKYAEANSEVLPRTDNPRIYKIKGSILALLWNEYHQVHEKNEQEKGEGEGNPVLRLCETIGERKMGTFQGVEVLRRFLQQVTKGPLEGNPHHSSFTKEEREAMFHVVWSLITPIIQKKVFPCLSPLLPFLPSLPKQFYFRSTRSSPRAFGPFDRLSYWTLASFAHMSATG